MMRRRSGVRHQFITGDSAIECHVRPITSQTRDDLAHPVPVLATPAN